MKKFFLLGGLLIILGGCTSSPVNTKVETGKVVKTAKEYVENNEFIDMNFENLDVETKVYDESSYSEEKMKAALYRFYKHVETTEKGIDVCNLKKGAEINISEDLFLALHSDMDRLNSLKIKQIEDGIKAVNPPLNDEYFENLLK